MQSCLYHGWVRHRRHLPRPHAFRYRVCQMFLALDELDHLLPDSRLFSVDRPNLVWFRRRDHIGDPDQPLADTVRDLVEQHGGRRPQGRVFLLTYPRIFGYVMNPVSFYYCYGPAPLPEHGADPAPADPDDACAGGPLETIVAEVHNTPWGETHCYVLDEPDNLGGPGRKRYRFDKGFHVSPFLPMEHRYDWRFRAPDRRLSVHMQNFAPTAGAVPGGARGGPAAEAGETLVFDATMVLEREPLTARSLRRSLMAYPFMTGKVIAAIYWQALRLWLARTPFYDHPRTRGRTPR
ncbi:DUF1365 domain-containing protein [Haliangium sp.]|uniref:DUF1365 domain-containing protein n=1 Tax=Haliangium sp. TaxID=2663208 RepID=UPI003D0EFDC2